MFPLTISIPAPSDSGLHHRGCDDLQCLLYQMNARSQNSDSTQAWDIIGVVCLAAAGLQTYAVAAQVAHVATNVWKFGLTTHVPISAGATMPLAFFVITALFVCLGVVTTVRLDAGSSPVRFCSRLSVAVLVCCGLVYGAMLSSPLVIIDAR